MIQASPTLLFRYSAITFNGHRIHYDLPYARDVEGYDCLVVQGPAQATLLFNLARSESGLVPRKFQYRGLSPAIAGNELTVCAGTGADSDIYWTQSAPGHVHMEAKTVKPGEPS